MSEGWHAPSCGSPLCLWLCGRPSPGPVSVLLSPQGEVRTPPGQPVPHGFPHRIHRKYYEFVLMTCTRREGSDTVGESSHLSPADVLGSSRLSVLCGRHTRPVAVTRHTLHVGPAKPLTRFWCYRYSCLQRKLPHDFSSSIKQNRTNQSIRQTKAIDNMAIHLMS